MRSEDTDKRVRANPGYRSAAALRRPRATLRARTLFRLLIKLSSLRICTGRRRDTECRRYLSVPTVSPVVTRATAGALNTRIKLRLTENTPLFMPSAIEAKPPPAPASGVRDGGRQRLHVMTGICEITKKGDFVLTEIERRSGCPRVTLPAITKPVRGSLCLRAVELGLGQVAFAQCFKLSSAIATGDGWTTVREASEFPSERHLLAEMSRSRPRAASSLIGPPKADVLTRQFKCPTMVIINKAKAGRSRSRHIAILSVSDEL